MEQLSLVAMLATLALKGVGVDLTMKATDVVKEGDHMYLVEHPGVEFGVKVEFDPENNKTTTTVVDASMTVAT